MANLADTDENKYSKQTFLNRFGLYDCKPDENGLFEEGMCVPRAQANFILYLAPLSFASGIYGWYNGHYFIATIPILVGCTTIIYWTNPINCWRRWIDILIAMGGLILQMSLAISAQYALPYYILKISAMICYPIGHYFHDKGYIWAGTLWHSGIHLLGNLANFVLYSGII